MSKHLLLIGGGHAHMVTLEKLHTFVEKGYRVSVIQPSEYHYYSGMGPGMLGGTYESDDIRFATKKVVEQQGGTFILGKAESIDPVNKQVFLEGNDTPIEYDVLSCNAGSYVPRETIVAETQEIFTAKPIEALLAAQKKIIELSNSKAINVAVVGGGPSSVEIAGNVQQLAERQAMNPVNVYLFAGKRLMSGQSVRIGKLAKKSLRARGVNVIEGSYVSEIGGGKVALENGETFQADIIFPCVGVKPSEIFNRSGLPVGPDGGLLVNKNLQSIGYPEIFGGGDCIYFEPSPLDKVGVYAVRENPVLYHNLMATLEGSILQDFDPGGKYLLIYNLGNDEGVFSKGFITFSGKLAFKIKDYIDRKFITTFQAIE